MKKISNDLVVERLDTIIDLLQRVVALELARQGANKQVIGKNLRMAKASVVKMLAGTRRDGERS